MKELEILEKLKEIRDPEIPIDIVNLGLVYGVYLKDGVAHIDMTLTVPSCPAKGFFAQHIRDHILKNFPELKDVVVNFVFEPAWSKDKISQEGIQKLRSMGWNI
ncbi:MAG: metal-sulfur cluster assembly factor [Aquificota bacterium]|jgi:metal-sulfur cluster biosynthetic enzyme|nr:metal-sulfur cluster assembly factor [Aquificaceae bacterium]MDM7266994.1 metal-sulfur cluster assembly factor [Aquificaceae bacterium]QWK13700.1 MAG: metal-sulfur cluster assembly factor [Aquificota bacterium]HAV39499.1 metal-sulfur cluster assembly factor [Aquificaceae bacterium]HCO39861.1 metal-sulfur cluster assembly factor [Aquificaceae bacterium]